MAIFEKKNEVKDKLREKTAFGSALANKVLLAPRITEKSFVLSERGEYTFRIGLQATKGEVKRSVEEVYGVHVEADTDAALARHFDHHGSLAQARVRTDDRHAGEGEEGDRETEEGRDHRNVQVRISGITKE